jgi:Ti-type conjugative transfer relaxase TraA
MVLKKMAIQFARLQYVQRSKGQSSCHKGAYNARDKIYDLRQEKNFDYSDRGDCAYHAVLLPEGASEKYKNISELWNTIEAIENRKDSQVAKEMVLALPDDAVITLQDRIAMTRSFVKKYFVDDGLICQLDIHEPHSKGNKDNWKTREDHEDGKNWHAHVLITTRRCTDEIFGLKAAELDVDVRKGKVVSTDKQWGLLWGNHQNKYFKDNGIDLAVDPVGVVPQIHLGPVRMRKPESLFEKENKDIQAQNKRDAQDERLVMQHLLRKESTFEKTDVECFAKKHVPQQEQENFFGRFWSSKELVLVEEKKYTSKTVLREEQKMVRMADRLANKNNAVAAPWYDIELNEEQKAVVDYVCGGPNLTCIEGRAGTGKSRALSAIRETYEAENYIVRGLAPTSAVADDMKKKGFDYAANTHQFLFGHHHRKFDIQYGREVWLIDEAAMISNPVMCQLLDKAWRYNAKVVLVGDDKQLHAIDRGGAFNAFTERFGSVSLETIMRQKDVAHRAITAQIAEGKTKEALDRMADMGMWKHYGQEYEAVQSMMNAWYENYKNNPNESFMILEYRNQYVKEFNNHVHSVLKARGEVGPEDIMIKTAQYGFGYFGVGDSFVFRENDAELGVYNGQRGFLIEAEKNRFVVRADDEKDIEFDPQKYNNFQHGYAGTLHSVQGRTFDHVFALHSEHVNQNLFYVAVSRHYLSCQYFSYGDREKVYQNVETGSYKELCPETFNVEPTSWLCNIVVSLKDYMCRNHEFYQNSARHYREKGVLITDREENAYLQGYRALYTEDKENWPSLEGIDVRTVLKHRDLEPFLREQGVSQCFLIDAGRIQSQMIGPYDRFHTFFQEHYKELKEHNITETQFRVRLFVLEQRLGENHYSSAEISGSKACTQLIEHEKKIRPELLKTHNEQMATQILYHFEKIGSMPTDKELGNIQQRVNSATQQFSSHQKDQIFTASLPREDQKMVQFQKQMERER